MKTLNFFSKVARHPNLIKIHSKFYIFLNFPTFLLFSNNQFIIAAHSGINHGIELHDDCLKYSYDRLEEFKQKSLALDEFDFCEPRFIKGKFF